MRQFVFNIGETMNGAACTVLHVGAGGGPGVLPPENLGNFICQTVHFGDICVIILSTKYAWNNHHLWRFALSEYL